MRGLCLLDSQYTRICWESSVDNSLDTSLDDGIEEVIVDIENEEEMLDCLDTGFQDTC